MRNADGYRTFVVNEQAASGVVERPHTTRLRAMLRSRFLSTTTFLLALTFTGACAKSPDLVVYCSLDQEFGEPLIKKFEKESGLTVRVEFDIEANKNVGLATRIREEAVNRPRCDVFWSNEFAQEVAFAKDGLLASYASPSAADIPAEYKDPEHRWTGFAARARVLIVNTKLVDPKEIRSMWDLFDDRWKGKAAMARPLAGNTLTHMASLPFAIGEADARRYVETAAKRAQSGDLNLANGNAHVMRLVREGQAAFGWTDSDDYNVAREGGFPVAAVYPDADTCGTLLVPNTVCLLAKAPHMENGKRFIDWILRPEIEQELAFSRSAQIPVRAGVSRPPHVVDARGFKAMTVDFKAVGETITKRTAEFQKLFLE